MLKYVYFPINGNPILTYVRYCGAVENLFSWKISMAVGNCGLKIYFGRMPLVEYYSNYRINSDFNGGRRTEHTEQFNGPKE